VDVAYHRIDVVELLLCPVDEVFPFELAEDVVTLTIRGSCSTQYKDKISSEILSGSFTPYDKKHVSNE
jgi:hypothetical protein